MDKHGTYMIKHPATKIVAALIVVAGLATAPSLNKDGPSEYSAINAPAVDPLPVQSPRFQINWQADGLALSGHTASLKHEQDLLQVASSSHPENTVLTDFQPLGIVPSYWEDTTIQVIYLLAETAFAQADLSVDEITIRGISDDKLGWQNRLAALTKALPPHVSISADTRFVDPAINVLEVCTRAFAAFETGPINFEESSAQFRSSAYPRLDRVVALANACRDSEVSITGYTDSSGDESWNQRLSLRRANRVGDYLVEGGVERARLNVSGAGSTAPIASDRTRYGRSLNRRIEIALSNDD